MPERLDRRGFFKKTAAWLGASAVVVGADTAYGRRISQETNPLSFDIMQDLEAQTETMIPHISFQGFENAKAMGASGYNLIPKPKGFAQMLLAMAYYEGGKGAVDQTKQAISERGLEIVLGQTIIPGAVGEVINPALVPSSPYRMTVEPRYLLSNLVLVQHEMYHVHQYIRDGSTSFLINSPLASGAAVLIFFPISSIVDKSKTLSRRRVLSSVLKLGAMTGVYIGFNQILMPYENQAYTQTDSNTPNTIASDPYFQFNADNLFDFRK